VVLEGQWKEGFAAIAAVGATNVGSIKVLSLSLSLLQVTLLKLNAYQ
jgi:phosphatidylserine decarboxylase